MSIGCAGIPVRAWFSRLLLAGLSVVVSSACQGAASSQNGERSGTSARAAKPREVRVVPSVEEQLVRTIAVTGTLAAEDQVTLSLKVTGRLDQLFVDLGSRVSKGQVIARLVPTDFTLRVSQADAALEQARARLGLSADSDGQQLDAENTAVVRQARAVLDEARLTLERTRTFVERGITARAELDAADAAFKVADSRYQDALEEVRNRQALLDQRRTELELARQALKDSSLTAPLDGVVRERQATPGQYLAAGSPVVTIVRMHPLRLRLAVPEREATSVRVGQDVRVTVEGDTTVHTGRVARVSPAIDETSRTLMVEAEVPNAHAELRPGSFANAEVVTAAQERAVLVPASAIVTFAGVDKVLTVEKGRAVEKRITTGRRSGDRVEIVSGLSAGESVILQPGNLIEGETVTVANAVSESKELKEPTLQESRESVVKESKESKENSKESRQASRR
jgi:RND family efflux transporter MFP subunit